MIKASLNTKNIHNNWDKYWQGTASVEAFNSGGASHPAIHQFWVALFNSTKSNFNNPKILDVASGNGAVIGCALSVFKDVQQEITALDVSASAIDNIKKRFPMVKGVVSDANSISLESNYFNIITSQFGVEYAGISAIYEAARLVAKDGQLILMLHIKNGCIHQECLQSLDAIKQLKSSQFIPLAINLFKTAFHAVNYGDRTAYEKAGTNLSPAIKKLENIMNELGQDVAGGTLSKLYNDIGMIHKKVQNYLEDDVIKWLELMELELDAYSGRMFSMCEAAIDISNFIKIKKQLQQLGFSIESDQPLQVPENEQPMAWILIANKKILI